MGIEFLEVRNTNRELIGILDNFSSVIWETDYYSTGAFEIYTQVTSKTVQMLKVDNYVTRIDDDNVGVIENVQVDYNEQDGKMIIATGHFCKIFLNRRLIYKLNSGTSGKVSILPTVSRGLVEVVARTLVNDHIINSQYPERNVPFIKLGQLNNINKRIRDENGNATQKQTSYANLLEYTDGMLQTYELGAYISFDRASRDLLYNVFEGKDRSRSNSYGNQPIIFSQDFSNLIASSYSMQTGAIKNTALIGGEGEGVNRFCAMIDVNATGLERREVWIDASSQSKTYDENGVQKEYTDNEYLALIKSAGVQAMADFMITETYEGDINLRGNTYKYRTDFNIGDRVSVEDNELGVYFNPRIIKVVESQDEQGYNILVSYAG